MEYQDEANEEIKDNFISFSEVVKNKPLQRPPAYPWQDLALRIIRELRVPNFKRNSVFKVCKENSKEFVERCFNDTKELCPSGEKWRYFFKIVAEETKEVSSHLTGFHNK